jgi:hypothetical protein
MKPLVNLASSLLPVSCYFLVWLNLQPWRWKRHISPKRRLISNRLHGIISQNIETFITTAVRTSNPANYSLISRLLRLLCFFFLVSWSGVGQSPVGAPAPNWSVVPASDDTWWMWSSRWNKNWQGKPKYSEKTCPIATLYTTNPIWPNLGSKPRPPLWETG